MDGAGRDRQQDQGYDDGLLPEGVPLEPLQVCQEDIRSGSGSGQDCKTSQDSLCSSHCGFHAEYFPTGSFSSMT